MLILKDNGEPFATAEAAKSKRTRMGAEGLDTNIIEVENGYALEKKTVKGKKRVPIGTRNVLTIDDKDPNFQYRIVNDQPGRIRMFKEAGWEVVKEKMEIGDPQAGQGHELGHIASKQVGGGKRGIVMRIRKEWYKEDQKAKAEKIKEAEAAMKLESNKPGRYGKTEIKSKRLPY